MKFLNKWGMALIPALALATPAFAVNAVPDPTLNNSELPGSVIIFPKFVQGTVNVDGTPFSRTEIELGAVCPAGLVCLENTKVKVRAHWVCPGAEGVNSNICNEQNFEITTLTINGKVIFSPDGTAIAGNPAFPAAPCARGYLIAWVENTADQPVKFDALIGNAVIRGPANTASALYGTGFSTAVSAYMAIPIQANIIDQVANPAVGGPVAPVLDQPLHFDAATGGYQRLTDVQVADVRFDKLTSGAGPAPNILSSTSLVFLTLDVRSGLPNNPVFLPLSFYNEKQVLTSIEGYEFVCWDQPSLAFLDSGTGNLGQAFQTTRKGIVIAGPANKVNINVGDTDAGPATLIGLVETNEGSAANGFNERKYNFNMSNWCVQSIAPGSGTCPLDSTVVLTTVVSTTFVP